MATPGRGAPLPRPATMDARRWIPRLRRSVAPSARCVGPRARRPVRREGSELGRRRPSGAPLRRAAQPRGPAPASRSAGSVAVAYGSVANARRRVADFGREVGIRGEGGRSKAAASRLFELTEHVPQLHVLERVAGRASCQQILEQAPHGLEPAAGVGLDGSKRQVELGGDLGLGEILVVGELQHLALCRRQLGQTRRGRDPTPGGAPPLRAVQRAAAAPGSAPQRPRNRCPLPRARRRSSARETRHDDEIGAQRAACRVVVAAGAKSEKTPPA